MTNNYRTNEKLVQERLQTFYDCNTSVWPFVQDANAIVNWLVSEDSCNQLGSELPLLIETWLAAHFYAVGTGQFSQETVGKSSGTYQGQTTKGYASTRWGQQALRLDITGRLAQQDKFAEDGNRRVASLHGPRRPYGGGYYGRGYY